MPQQKNVLRSTRLITLVCRNCGQSITEERYPGPQPRYCSACKSEVIRAKARARVAAHRQRKAEQLHVPVSHWPENRRGYRLAVLRPGRMVIDATTGEGCLQAVQSCEDGELFTIVGHHRDQEIGRGNYRKHGAPGWLEGVETLSVSGDLRGLIESALAKREAEKHQQLQAERASRLIQIACVCGQSVGFDRVDQCFAHGDGQVMIACPACKKPLDLKALEQARQQQIARLQHELRQQRDALQQIWHAERGNG